MPLYIFPTDTVYGIGCSIFDRKSQQKIYKIKNRPENMPLLILCASLKQVEEIALVDEKARKIIDNFMPGALSIIVFAKKEIREMLGYSTIGIRIPNSKTALKLLSEIGPMTTTSVNESGEPPLNDYQRITEKYGDIVDFILPPEESISNISSTIVNLTTPYVSLIREGEITLKEINALLSE